MTEILRLAAGWLAATRVSHVDPGFGVSDRSMIRRAARVLESGMRDVVAAAGSSRPQAHTLPPRDREIVALLAAGYTYGRVAEQIGISYGSVHTRVKALYKRFGVHSKLRLLEVFRENGWTEPRARRLVARRQAVAAEERRPRGRRRR